MRFSAIAFLLLTGCATAPPPMPSAPIDYGEPLEVENAVDQAKAMMNGFLKDPYSAVWRCADTMHKGMLGSGRLWGAGSEDLYGWVLDCEVNGKNSYGAYSGASHYQFLFRQKVVFRIAEVGLGMGATRVIYSR